MYFCRADICPAHFRDPEFIYRVIGNKRWEEHTDPPPVHSEFDFIKCLWVLKLNLDVLTFIVYRCFLFQFRIFR